MKFGHRHILKEDDAKTGEDDGQLQAKKRGLEDIFSSRHSEETNPAGSFISYF